MSHKTLVNGTVYEVGGGKTLIDGVAYSIDKGKALVDGTAYEVGFGTPISSLAEGTLINLNYGSTTRRFRILKHDYESGLNGAGRTLLIDEQGSYPAGSGTPDRIVWNESGVNTYANSTMDNWLNSTYKGRFDADVQSAMGSTTFYYTPGNGNNTVTTLSRSVFIASHTERFGGTHSNTNVEGSYIPTVTQMGSYRGFGGWFRTPFTNSTDKALYASYYGYSNSWTKSAYAVSNTMSINPMFTLPSNFTNYTV